MKDVIRKWWFWVIMAIVFLGILGAIVPSDQTCTCPKTYEQEYLTCVNQINDINQAWDEYIEAMDTYCSLDPTNLLCNI